MKKLQLYILIRKTQIDADNKKEVKNDVINIILNSYKIVDKKCEKPELIKQIIK